MARHDLRDPVARFCLALETDRRTKEGRVRSPTEFREHFFPYDASSATDRILRLLPREVRGPILVEWGIRGKKTAMRDDDDRVSSALHDALVAGDVDDEFFERGISAEIVIEWSDLSEWWTFWRGGRHTSHSVTLALETAYELGLFEARWLFDVIEDAEGFRGTDVVARAMSEAELGDWIKTIHRTGDGSPKGLLEAIGWPVLVAKTKRSVVLSIIDAFARKEGLAMRRSPAERNGDEPSEAVPPSGESARFRISSIDLLGASLMEGEEAPGPEPAARRAAGEGSHTSE